MVRSVGTTQRYIGLSTDTKPTYSNDSERATIGAGSTFLEADTGEMYRWNGNQWLKPEADETVTDLLRAILGELIVAREARELAEITR